MRRLPFLVFIALGLWLWKGSLFPQERELVWRLSGGSSAIRELEIQLWDQGGHLLKREQFFFRQPTSQVIQKVSLKQGRYTARIFVQREGMARSEKHERAVEIGEPEAYGLSISDGR